jgi:hypothetical protein
MVTTTVTNTHMMTSEQEATRRRQSSPLLLSLIGRVAQEQQPSSFVSEIATHITRRVEQHVRFSVAPAIYCDDQMSDLSTLPDRLGVALSAWLHQGVRRLLLVPWGGGQAVDAWIEATSSALQITMGEEVRRTTMASPCVHVDGVSVRRAFEGYASVQDQLNPLVEQFPGWGRTYICFSAGDAKIVLLHSPECTRQQPRRNALEASIVKALTAALCSTQMSLTPASDLAQWKKDGHIYAHYLVSLLCAVTESLQREERTLNNPYLKEGCYA